MNKVLFSSNKDDWQTPIDLFKRLDNIYNFDIDLCASDDYHLKDIYFTKDRSCFMCTYEFKSIFCNPPYSRYLYNYIKLCYNLAFKFHNQVVLLVPARTDTKWFHDYIYNKYNVRIEFIKGRLKFGGSKNSAPFPSMLVYFNCKVV